MEYGGALLLSELITASINVCGKGSVDERHMHLLWCLSSHCADTAACFKYCNI